MSGALPVLSGAEVVKALDKLGYPHDRTKGDHAILKHPGPLTRDGAYRTVAVPLHRELARGTLAGILRRMAITSDELRVLL